jgi:hypothetical protein
VGRSGFNAISGAAFLFVETRKNINLATLGMNFYMRKKTE